MNHPIRLALSGTGSEASESDDDSECKCGDRGRELAKGSAGHIVHGEFLQVSKTTTQLAALANKIARLQKQVEALTEGPTERPA